MGTMSCYGIRVAMQNGDRKLRVVAHLIHSKALKGHDLHSKEHKCTPYKCTPRHLHDYALRFLTYTSNRYTHRRGQCANPLSDGGTRGASSRLKPVQSIIHQASGARPQPSGIRH